MRIIVFDSETTGTNSQKHSLLTLGALAGDLDTGEIFEQFEVYHKMPSLKHYNVTEGAQQVHGITPEICMEKGITTEEIQTRFADLYYNNNCVLLGGHGVNFDVRFLCDQIYKISYDEFTNTFTYRVLDTMPLIRLFAGVEDVKQGASLKQTVKALNIDMSDVKVGSYHAALYDAICTFRILCKFRRVLSDPTIVEKLVK